MPPGISASLHELALILPPQGGGMRGMERAP
jgi:hypothetical protein